MCSLLSIVIRIYLLNDEDVDSNSTLNKILKAFTVICVILDLCIISTLNETYPIR